ncbi:hypothetical protein GCM10010439_64970 [Actinocorallia aurantiaca]|uniref:Uncharacterized protein n=1 Tax=Actinocorallia aurantiaca TaxID=46204 RepID=A0ABP6H4M4_9ACTN
MGAEAVGRFFDVGFPGVGTDVQSALDWGAAEVDERLAQGVPGRARRFGHREGGQVPDTVPGSDPGVLLECVPEEVRVGGEGTRGVLGRAQFRLAASALAGEPAFGHEAFDARPHLLVAHAQAVGDGVQLVRSDGAVFAEFWETYGYRRVHEVLRRRGESVRSPGDPRSIP